MHGVKVKTQTKLNKKMHEHT